MIKLARNLETLSALLQRPERHRKVHFNINNGKDDSIDYAYIKLLHV